MPDLSQQTGNPTSYIHDNYQDLMALCERDPEAAAAQVIRAAESMVGTGLSVINFKKLKMRAIQAAQRGAFGIQKFLSDYLLAGTDPSLKVSSVSRFEEIEALGTLICEDINRPPIEWTRELLFIKEVAESHGLTIIREESADSERSGQMRIELRIEQALKALLTHQDIDTVNEIFTRIMCEGGQYVQVDLTPDPRHHCNGIVRIHNEEGLPIKLCKFVVSADTIFCSHSPEGKASLPGESA